MENRGGVIDYNWAELPVNDVLHVKNVIEVHRKVSEAMRLYGKKRREYTQRYYRKKLGLV